jgi:hypothetical protein
MKVTETTSQPASFLQKEVRGIFFSEIAKDDFAELHCALDYLFTPNSRRNCILDVAISRTDVWLKNKREASLFALGFYTAMALADPDFPRKRETLSNVSLYFNDFKH